MLHLQAITFAHTLLHCSERTNINTVLVICPLNTVLNWHNEWMKWIPSRLRPEVRSCSSCNHHKKY